MTARAGERDAADADRLDIISDAYSWVDNPNIFLFAIRAGDGVSRRCDTQEGRECGTRARHDRGAQEKRGYAARATDRSGSVQPYIRDNVSAT